MALKKCPDCGKLVSERAAKCPECGCPSSEFIDNAGEDTTSISQPIQNENMNIHGYSVGNNTTPVYPTVQNKIMTNRKFAMIIGIIAGAVMIIGVFLPFFTINWFGREATLSFFKFGGFNDGYIFLGIGALALTAAIFKRGIPLIIMSAIDGFLAFWDVFRDTDNYLVLGPSVGFYVLFYGALVGIVVGILLVFFKVKKIDEDECTKRVKTVVALILAALAICIVVFELVVDKNISKRNSKKSSSYNYTESSNYDSKALLDDDITNAKIIKTAIETAMASEKTYVAMTETYGDVVIGVNEKTFAELPSSISDSIMKNVGDFPSIKYTEDGAVGFAFMVTKGGSVKMYISSQDDITKWVIDGYERVLDTENPQTTQKSLAEIDVTTATTTAAPTTTEATTEVKNSEPYDQVVVVSAASGSSYATMELREWNKGSWDTLFSCNATVGMDGGISANNSESNTLTPKGSFPLGVVLTSTKQNTKMEQYTVTSQTAVVDDTSYPEYYNQIYETNNLPSGVHVDYVGNKLLNGENNALIFIQHNGSGFSSAGVSTHNSSVITICGCYDSIQPTYGCIDISSSDMTKLLSLLDKTKNPYLITEVY